MNRTFLLAFSNILTNEYSETYYTDDGAPVTSTPEALVSQVKTSHFIYTAHKTNIKKTNKIKAAEGDDGPLNV